MQIDIPKDAQTQSVAAGYASVEQYIHSLVDRDRERLEIQKGIDAMQAGKSSDFGEFDRQFRQQNGIAD